MNKYLFIGSLTVFSVGAAQAQSYIAGLDFGVNSFSSDVAFNKGAEQSSFSLIIQSGAAEDNYSWDASAFPGFGTFTEANWAAAGETYSDGTNSQPVGAFADLPVTVLNISGGGFTPSTDLFGGTSAFAQGFSDAHGIAFGSNVNGIFQIAIGTSSLGGGFENVSLSFDVAALATESQTAGNLLVNGNSVSVTASAANQVVSLGNFNAGDFITFDLSGLSDGASFDNFMIAGTAVVPEPSTYAAIFGVIALGFAAFRRRKAA